MIEPYQTRLYNISISIQLFCTKVLSKIGLFDKLKKLK